MKAIIDLPEDSWKVLAELAKKKDWSRKKYAEWVLSSHVDKKAFESVKKSLNLSN